LAFACSHSHSFMARPLSHIRGLDSNPTDVTLRWCGRGQARTLRLRFVKGGQYSGNANTSGAVKSSETILESCKFLQWKKVLVKKDLYGAKWLILIRRKTLSSSCPEIALTRSVLQNART
jgi:hypothetical protein